MYIQHISRYKLLIINKLGYLPIDKENSNLSFQLIDMRKKYNTYN